LPFPFRGEESSCSQEVEALSVGDGPGCLPNCILLSLTFSPLIMRCLKNNKYVFGMNFFIWHRLKIQG
jgi:hypothetical protein